jgi:hypothetical protein
VACLLACGFTIVSLSGLFLLSSVELRFGLFLFLAFVAGFVVAERHCSGLFRGSRLLFGRGLRGSRRGCRGRSRFLCDGAWMTMLCSHRYCGRFCFARHFSDNVVETAPKLGQGGSRDDFPKTCRRVLSNRPQSRCSLNNSKHPTRFYSCQSKTNPNPLIQIHQRYSDRTCMSSTHRCSECRP